VSMIFDSDRESLNDGSVRLLQANSELFLRPKSKFGFRFDGMSDGKG